MRGMPAPLSKEFRFMGVILPLGGWLGATGIFRSSGELGMVSSGSPGMRILVASLL